MIDYATHKAILDKVEECYQIAEEHYDRNFRRPEVRFTLRGRTAGTAMIKRGQYILNFHPVFIREYFDDYINSTVPHEVAHLIDEELYNSLTVRNGKRRSPHGIKWKSVMRVLGANPERTHSYDVTKLNSTRKRSQKIFPYVCTGCGAELNLGAIRHRRAQQGTKYRHGCVHRAVIEYRP